MPVGVLLKRALNPIRKAMSRGVGECSAFSTSIRNAVGSPVQAMGECVTQSTGYKSKSSSSQAIGECIVAPVWSNQKSSSSSVIGECISQEIAGAGAGGVDIYDEGILVKSKAAHIDIVGADSQAALDGLGVKIYHPPPAYVSHFNTSDGTNVATVNGLATSARYVSAPTIEGTPFYSGGASPWGGAGDGAFHPCTRTSPVSWSTANNCLFDDLNTVILVQVSNSTGIIATHTETNITNNLSTSAQNITITVASWAIDSDKYQADVTIQLDLNALLPAGGYFEVLVRHTSDGINYDFNQTGVFFDNETLAAVLTGVTITENVPVTVQLSGVYYYDTGSTFTVAIADIDNLNAETYPLNQVTLNGTEYGLPTLNIPGPSLIGWGAAFDDANDSYSNAAWTIDAVDYCIVTASGNISARIEDWTSGSWVNSADASICVNTYTDNSTRIYEDFRTENRRRTSTWTAWDNTQDLLTYDDNQGLQYQCSRLIYPSANFGTYSPNSGSQPDYSLATGTRTLFWSIYHNGTSHSNGVFQFGDHNITESDITADDFLLEISLDSVNWFNCNELYVGGALNNGDGCRTNIGLNSLAINNQISFTLGTGGFTDASTGPADEGNWGLYVRISWTAAISAKYLGSIGEITWV